MSILNNIVKDDNLDEKIELISEQITKEVLGHLFNQQNLKQNTRIKPEQISAMSKASVYAQTYNLPFLQDFINNIMQLQVSIHGLGRKEMVQMVQRINDDQTLLDTKKKFTF